MFVYIIKADGFPGSYQDRSWGYVKIGITKNLNQRLKAIQTGSPYKLRIHRFLKVKTMNQALKIEEKLHDKLAMDRVMGEWFTYTARVAGLTNRYFNAVGGGYGEEIY